MHACASTWYNNHDKETVRTFQVFFSEKGEKYDYIVGIKIYKFWRSEF